ncbi:MAG: carbamoyl phosphate synthase small subunit [Planctomycetota bacterium]|jgi:carbamoyl-phosphate synthase small subunit
MDGYILLADGLKLEGVLLGPPRTAIGRLVANTAVVGFQEMATDPAYQGTILAFTYPEVGNVGVAAAFSESPRVQAAALVVKVLSDYRSHYLSEDDFVSMLAQDGLPCLADVDTRGLAVHLREAGEMTAAVASEQADVEEVKEAIRAVESREFLAPEPPAVPVGGSGPRVAVLNLGVRRSQLTQLAAGCSLAVHPHDADAGAVLADSPAAVFISDGPGTAVPPLRTVETVRALLGQVPLFGCGLGHIALGMALGCEPAFLKRGHHGANYPVRNLADGIVEVTQQRHTVTLDRDSVTGSPEVELLWENINDGTVEGIRAADGSAIGFQSILAAPQPGLVNAHIRQFVESLRGA